MKAKIAGALLIFIVLSGCASTSGNQSINNETQQSIASKIVKGRTTEAEVLSLYGEPTGKNFVDSNKERWLYSLVKSKMTAATYIPIIGLFSNGTEMKAKSLSILFENGKVATWSLSEGNNSVHNGI
ncbi:hypothetical protein [Pantoea agglomerans]|uniref:hypothetical protein n=1 Tax=Enterobacter agglomerans TaxID=549 RepID=UPI0010C23C97|nr:hypothetical protein [Pantoea agglomerans]MBD8223217.1 hypothetical protein [Pantoea agglomerans]TKK25320.1 hypothetical protein PagCFBP13532_23270 [Pantoea agglomerans]